MKKQENGWNRQEKGWKQQQKRKKIQENRWKLLGRKLGKDLNNEEEFLSSINKKTDEKYSTLYKIRFKILLKVKTCLQRNKTCLYENIFF